MSPQSEVTPLSSDGTSHSQPRSRKFVWIFLMLLVLALCVGGWWATNQSADEPTYEGEPLSYWAQQFEPDPAGNKYRPIRLTTESATAVRAMGTNALPTILAWMVRPETGIDAAILNWIEENNGISMRLKRFSYQVFVKKYRPGVALLVFRALGPDATNAIPALVQRLHSPLNSPFAVMALCAIGPDGATALTKEVLKVVDGITRANIIFQLEHEITSGLEPHFALFLAQRLKDDTHAGVRGAAAHVLGSLTNSAATAVPVLTTALQDSDSSVRFRTAASLGKFGSAAKPAVGSLHEALGDPRQFVREQITNALFAIQGSVTVATNTPVSEH